LLKSTEENIHLTIPRSQPSKEDILCANTSENTPWKLSGAQEKVTK
jgi:hypothetical protein